MSSGGWRRRLWRAGADTATALVFAAGLGAIALHTHDRLALVLMTLAALLDGVDGPMARRAGGGTRYGALGDAVADLTAFAVAPAAVVLGASTSPSPVIARALLVASLLYVGAAAVRLVRGYRDGRQAWGYVGQPMPAAAALYLALALDAPPAAAVAAAIAVGVLATSERRYPSVSYMWRERRGVFVVGLAVAGLALPWSPRAAALWLAVVYAVCPWRVEPSAV